MGDCGNFSANVSIEFSLKKKEKNSVEECEAFIHNGELSYVEKQCKASEESITYALTDGKQVKLEYRDWETWDSENHSEEELIEALDEYYDKEFYTVKILRKAVPKDLEHLDLELVDKYSKKSIDSKAMSSVQILSTHGSIYCDKDNATATTIKIQQIKKYLGLPKAVVTLEANGDGHC